MRWSAPIDRTRSTFLVLHTPVTSAPNALAICTANVPTPPAAQDPLARLDPPLIAKSLEGCGSRDGYGRSLLEREPRRLRRKVVLATTHVLGKGAAARAEDLI